MEPLTEKIEKSKSQAIEGFLETLDEMNIPVLGRDDELGLVSFEKNNGLFYAHFIEVQKNEAKIAIAPGLSYMKDRDGVNSAVIKEVINEISNKSESQKK